MMTRKMLLMGAMLTTVLNVSTLGAWANPSTGKVVASAKRATGTTKPSLTRVAFFAAPSSDADSGCPPTVEDGTVDQVPLNPFGGQPDPKTPCGVARDATTSVQIVSDTATNEAQKAANELDAAKAALAAEQLEIKRENLNAAITPVTEAEVALQAAVDLAAKSFNRLAAIAVKAGEDLADAEADEKKACAKHLIPDPHQPKIEGPLDFVFPQELTTSSSGALS